MLLEGAGAVRVMVASLIVACVKRSAQPGDYNGLAQAIRVPSNQISLIINEKRGITAVRLGRYFGTSPHYWLNIQNRFDLDSLDQAVIERDVIPKRAA